MPPAARENRTPRIYYATQVGVAPPTIVLFVNSTKLFDPTYQRYLLNVFREKLPFRDIPIKLYMRSRKQTEPGERSSSDRPYESDDDQEMNPAALAPTFPIRLPSADISTSRRVSSTAKSMSCSLSWMADKLLPLVAWKHHVY